MKPGIYTMTAEDYHADKIASRPSLSASMAHLLCTSSPAHAWVAHPKLNPAFERHEEEKFDVGTVAHALLLQGEDVAVVVDAPDWRTNAAKEERDAARAAGQIPLLAKHWDAVRAMVAATRQQLDKIDTTPALFTDGKPEVTYKGAAEKAFQGQEAAAIMVQNITKALADAGVAITPSIVDAILKATGVP